MSARLPVTAAAVAVLCLVAAGCGSREEDGGGAAVTTVAGATGGAGSTAAPAPSEDCTPGPSAEMGEEYIHAFPQNPTSLDKDLMTNPAGTNIFLYPVYDGLVTIDPEGNFIPSLASEWTVSDDGNVLEMELIEGWTFHDGEPFNAEAVKANIERSRDLPRSFHGPLLAGIESIEVVDDNTVRLTTDGVAGALVGVFATPAGLMMSPAKMDVPGQDTLPTGGSGKFRVVKYVPDQGVEYEAVENYWQEGLPRTKKLTIQIVRDDSARLNALTTGVIHTGSVRGTQVATAESAGVTVCTLAVGHFHLMVMNTARGILASPEIREAINLAVDREAVVASLDGYCRATRQIFPAEHYAHNPDVTVERNLDEARRLVAASGESNPSFDIVFTNAPQYQGFAEIIQQNLGEVGITVNLIPMPYTQLVQEFTVNKAVDAVIYPQTGELEPSILVEQYLSADGVFNPGGATSPDIERLSKEAMASADPEERAPLYREIAQLAADLPSGLVTLCHSIAITGAQDDVRGYVQYADAVVRFDEVSAGVE